MASQSHRLLDPATGKADLEQSLREAFDAGAYRELGIDARVLKSGTAGNLIIQHAAVNEEDAYRDLATATFALNGSGDFVYVTEFLRYVRWRMDSSVAGNPVVLVDLIAKGG